MYRVTFPTNKEPTGNARLLNGEKSPAPLAGMIILLQWESKFTHFAQMEAMSNAAIPTIKKAEIDAKTATDILSAKEDTRAEFRLRKEKFDYIKVHPADVDDLVAKGWDRHKDLQRATWLKRQKTFDKQLEDDTWCLFYRMGYPTLNQRGFKLRYERDNGSTGTKQIDILAKDDETVIIAECKSRETLGRRSLAKDLLEFEALQKAFANAIRKYFGPGFTPKIIWLFVTRRIIWSPNDVEKAQSANIQIITDNELTYYETFVAHMGNSGRYQFLAEYLEGQDIPALKGIKIPAVKSSFSKDVNYYSFVISARHLLKISFVNHQALNHPDGRPAYQRMIKKKRIKAIGDFISGGGYFPTNLLVNFTEHCLFEPLPKAVNGDKDISFGMLTLPSKYKSAWIIDGQHRLYGFSDLEDELLDTKLVVLAFEKLDVKKEAELFITINHEQQSVPKGLLVVLQADLKVGADDPREAISALSSSLIRSLNLDATSPLYGRFAVPDVPASEMANLTIAEIAKGVTRSHLLGRAIGRNYRVSGHLSGATDLDTLKRGRRVMNGYFRAIMDANPQRWAAGRSAYICVNPGIRAHFQLVGDALDFLQSKNVIDPQLDLAETIIEKLADLVSPFTSYVKSATDAEIEQLFSRKFGEGGVREYYYNMIDLITTQTTEFGGDDYRKYKLAQSDSRFNQAGIDLADIQNAVAKICVETLKNIHGTSELKSGEKAYWDKGIESSDIKEKAYKKQQQTKAEKRGPKEAYIDFIDWIKIIKQPSNWEDLEPFLSIPMTGEKGKKYYLDWIEKINDLRPTAAHKTPYRTFEDQDYEFISTIKGEIFKRASARDFDL